jgi:hypothetical protein
MTLCTAWVHTRGDHAWSCGSVVSTSYNVPSYGLMYHTLTTTLCAQRLPVRSVCSARAASSARALCMQCCVDKMHDVASKLSWTVAAGLLVQPHLVHVVACTALACAAGRNRTEVCCPARMGHLIQHCLGTCCLADAAPCWRIEVVVCCKVMEVFTKHTVTVDGCDACHKNSMVCACVCGAFAAPMC